MVDRFDGVKKDPPAIHVTLDQLIAQRHALAASARAPIGSSPWAGTFRGSRRGQGLDFDDLRPYVPGDDVRHIDWKASARLGETQMRLYREEKEHTVTIALDLRDSMFTGSHRLRAVTACLEAARQAWHFADQGCRVGLVVFDSDDILVSRAGIRERGALAACALAATRSSERATSVRAARNAADPPSPALPVVVDRLLRYGRRLGSLCLVSGLDDMTSSPAAGRGTDPAALALRRLALAMPCTLLLIEDPIEQVALPAGRYRFRTAEGVAAITLDAAARERLDATLAGRRGTIAELCRTADVWFDPMDRDARAGAPTHRA